MDIDIVVVASPKRPPLIVPHLSAVPHIVSITPDYILPFPYLARPKYQHLKTRCHIGAYRCFCGHQDALKASSGDYILVLEDDAVPNDTQWLSTVTSCIPLLDTHDIISLHGRDIISPLETFTYKGSDFIVPGPKDDTDIKWCIGSLAYLLHRTTANKILSMQYEGLPMDLLLSTCFKFCVINKSPFDHDRSQGSIVESARNNRRPMSQAMRQRVSQVRFVNYARK